MDEESPAEMIGRSALLDRSKMELKDLPIEIMELILHNIPPDKRRHLRRVNKRMLKAVDRSMSDVKLVSVSHYDDYCFMMTTVDSFTGKVSEHYYEIAASSIPFLLRWAFPLTDCLQVMTDAR